MSDDSPRCQGHNTPLRRSPPANFKRLFDGAVPHARLEETGHRDRVRYLDNQLVVALVLQRDHDDPLWIVDIPEYTLPVLIGLVRVCEWQLLVERLCASPLPGGSQLLGLAR